MDVPVREPHQKGGVQATVVGFWSRVSGVVLGLALLLGAWKKFGATQSNNFYKQQIHFSDATNKIILITGANSGLGYESAKMITRHSPGVRLLMACRNAIRCEDARKELLTKSDPTVEIDTFTLDLSSLSSVRHFAEEVLEHYPQLDVIVNNAGAFYGKEREITEDGLEATMATNHLGHFLLTSLLYPALRQNGRIVNHSSFLHLAATEETMMDFLSENDYGQQTAYGKSKLAQLHFTYMLNRRLQTEGNPRNISAIAVHPGYASTNLQPGRISHAELMAFLFATDAHEGALSLTYAIVDDSAPVIDGTYIGPRYILFGPPTPTSTSALSTNLESQKHTWEESENLTGAKFNL